MQNPSSLRWSYGVTTVPSRFETYLIPTLMSLSKGGFDKPRLFVDGKTTEGVRNNSLGLPITERGTPVRSYGNWLLGLMELFLRNPESDRFAMFQDDFITYPNLKTFLDHPKTTKVLEARGYLNLFTMPSNRIPEILGENKNYRGWYPSNQKGRGAVALVFSRDGVRTLLSHQHTIDKPMDPHRGHNKIDGGIIESMSRSGWTEYVHTPSLVKHTGEVSSMGNNPHANAVCFLGDQFDATELCSTSEVRLRS